MQNFTRRSFSLTSIAAALLASSNVFAQAAKPAMAMMDGKDYRSVKPAVKTDDAKKIEVIEFFWYGCPHCYSLEPGLVEWAKRLPADVSFKKVHVTFQQQVHQQLFFTLETMGREKDLTAKVFYRIHSERDSLLTAEKQADYLAQFGVDKKAFMDTFKSFGVSAKMKRAAQLQDAYKIDGVPGFAINGKYYTAPTMAGSNAAAIAVVEALIERERKGGK